MDQKKIGDYIREKRKVMSLTQKELAEQLNISDKTISKWECGNGLPDFGSLKPLCDALDISVNELLAGEDISSDTYAVKAEENIMSLFKENEKQKKGNRISIVMGVVFTGLALLLWIYLLGETGVSAGMYFDVPSVVLLVLVCGAGVLFSGVHDKREIPFIIKKMIIPVGTLDFVFQSIIVFYSRIDNMVTLMINLSVCMLTLFYALIIYLIMVPICHRISREDWLNDK